MNESSEPTKPKSVAVRCDSEHLDRARRVMTQRLGIPTLNDRAVLDVALQAYDPTERWSISDGPVGALLVIPQALAEDIRSRFDSKEFPEHRDEGEFMGWIIDAGLAALDQPD